MLESNNGLAKQRSGTKQNKIGKNIESIVLLDNIRGDKTVNRINKSSYRHHSSKTIHWKRWVKNSEEDSNKWVVVAKHSKQEEKFEEFLQYKHRTTCSWVAIIDIEPQNRVECCSDHYHVHVWADNTIAHH